VQVVLGYYEEYQSALQFDRVLPLFALEASDVWIYSGKGTPPLLPRPPEPYRTFSETFSY
jgi:hypothetical protein